MEYTAQQHWPEHETVLAQCQCHIVQERVHAGISLTLLGFCSTISTMETALRIAERLGKEGI